MLGVLLSVGFPTSVPTKDKDTVPHMLTEECLLKNCVDAAIT